MAEEFQSQLLDWELQKALLKLQKNIRKNVSSSDSRFQISRQLLSRLRIWQRRSKRQNFSLSKRPTKNKTERRLQSFLLWQNIILQKLRAKLRMKQCKSLAAMVTRKIFLLKNITAMQNSAQ